MKARSDWSKDRVAWVACLEYQWSNQVTLSGPVCSHRMHHVKVALCFTSMRIPWGYRSWTQLSCCHEAAWKCVWYFIRSTWWLLAQDRSPRRVMTDLLRLRPGIPDCGFVPCRSTVGSYYIFKFLFFWEHVFQEHDMFPNMSKQSIAEG